MKQDVLLYMDSRLSKEILFTIYKLQKYDKNTKKFRSNWKKEHIEFQ